MVMAGTRASLVLLSLSKDFLSCNWSSAKAESWYLVLLNDHDIQLDQCTKVIIKGDTSETAAQPGQVNRCSVANQARYFVDVVAGGCAFCFWRLPFLFLLGLSFLAFAFLWALAFNSVSTPLSPCDFIQMASSFLSSVIVA